MRKTFTEFSKDEPIIGMTTYRDFLIIATSRGVYRASDQYGPFEKLEFVQDEESEAPTLVPSKDDEILS